MGFLDNAIRKGINNAVGNAIGNAVESAVKKAVEPAATNLANRAAESFNEAVGNTVNEAARTTEQAARTTEAAARETSRSTSELGGAFASLQSAMEGYATAMGKNIKVCPKCDETVSADEKFCPHCGAKLPEISLAEGALCPKCGKQNTIGTKFCSGCGEKLPQAVYEEEAARENDAAELNLFREKLPQYPVWSCGGYDYTIEEGDEWFSFTVTFGSDFEAEKGVNKYRELLKENGFREAGEYPSIEHLYKMVNGKCYHVDTEHCWNGDANCPTIYFNIDEPTGGFNYVKPEPKPEISGLSALKGLFGR